MEIPIVAGILGLGYYYNSKSDKVTNDTEPKNIYDSKRSLRIRQDELKHAENVWNEPNRIMPGPPKIEPTLLFNKVDYDDVYIILKTDQTQTNIDKRIPSDYMKTSIQSLNNYIDYTINALIYEYSNGRLEGINNKIKVIKRIAFGYRSFYHFRNRILINLNIVKIKAA